jgi:hypothetical protein
VIQYVEWMGVDATSEIFEELAIGDESVAKVVFITRRTLKPGGWEAFRAASAPEGWTKRCRQQGSASAPTTRGR